MKPDFLQAIQNAVGHIEHIHIEESGVDSLLIHHDDPNKLTQVAKTLESQKFHSVIRHNGSTSFIEVTNK
ncbi:hypothetical protein ACO11K_002270 [Bacillus cytotoxicus]|uniref:hypothetical protein n=1 Tax=Bacillus cereus group sp. BfR-BA-01492 TaxID=2920361 RepID=UPI001F5A27B1|nr:hypothetical protein [Bacillus cereus group sp. BfR-BA-01492]EMA6343489.1 hypothetical protein [Bacillus cytotoxicus]